jgi:16S rRNA (cytosine967-C5)-methyltransferase
VGRQRLRQVGRTVGLGGKRVLPRPPQKTRERQARGAAPGAAARDLAHRLIAGVLLQRRPLDQILADQTAHPGHPALEPRDRAFARVLAATVLRRLGELEHVLAAFLQRPLPKEAGRARVILLAGTVQIVCLGTPPHAAVDMAVAAVRRERGGARFAGLVNAVLRRVVEKGAARLDGADAIALNVPAWLLQRWRLTYGADTARHIAEASLREAPLDITLKPGADPALWASRLEARVLPTGSLRLAPGGRIEDLAGYAEGDWWVQDAAAALVARVAGDVQGKTVADLCAAPGGKTAWLAAAGAAVTAVDVSPKRLDRLTANLQRLALSAEIVAADATTWTPGRQFDAVILDAPCTATGTIRRHPDILHLKQPDDIARMAALQSALFANAARLVRPGGTLVYSTCSLEPEEGERQVEAFLAANPSFSRSPLDAAALGADPSWLTTAGELRTLPHHLPGESPELSGLDGFFVARLQRHT